METTRNIEVAGPARRIESTSRIYLLLGRFFSYPDGRFYGTTKDPRIQEDLRSLVDGLPFDVKFEDIPSPSVPQDEFESEYINSFDITPPCPLYEFHYRSGELTRREILEELLCFYGHFDVKLSETEKDYPDHLVAELEFMAFLAMKEADAGERGTDPDPYRRAQRDFLERHLGRWVDRLDARIRKVTRERFYRGASFLLREFVKSHLLHLREQGSAESIVPPGLGGDCAEREASP
ncbi:MAG: molecular chaperone TorD family protein [Nitrospirae bacterium]|nr:molecular chaperone TorD family protein [Nitrospirota bacterium]